MLICRLTGNRVGLNRHGIRNAQVTAYCDQQVVVCATNVEGWCILYDQKSKGTSEIANPESERSVADERS